MQNHVKVYYEYFHYGEEDVIMCEFCRIRRAVDICHIIPRSKFGKNRKEEQDDIKNLMAGCRECHTDYDDKYKWTVEEAQEIHLNHMIAFLQSNVIRFGTKS